MARRKYVHVGAYRRRFPTFGDAQFSSAANTPTGPSVDSADYDGRLWSLGPNATPRERAEAEAKRQAYDLGQQQGQAIMVRNVKPSDDGWAWLLVIWALSRR